MTNRSTNTRPTKEQVNIDLLSNAPNSINTLDQNNHHHHHYKMTRTTLPPPSTHPTDKALPPETSLLLLTRLTSRIEHNLHTPTSCASIEVLRRDSLRRERVCGVRSLLYST